MKKLFYALIILLVPLTTWAASQSHYGILDQTGTSGSLYGTGVDGALTDKATDSDATTITQTNATTPTDNVTLRATGNVAINNAITIGKQTGQARGSFPTTHGSPGIDISAVLVTIGSKGIPQPMTPGGATASMNGGRLQILSGGTVDVSGTITSVGTNVVSEGGGGGGLVIIIAKTSITGASAIDVAGATGHATAAAKGGSGSYSGEPGGHAGIGGSGGGGAYNGGVGGSGGAGFIVGLAGGTNSGGGGAGGGSLDIAGSNSDGDGLSGGAGGACGDKCLNRYIGLVMSPQKASPTDATAGTTGTGDNAGTGGGAGANGGGGGGGGRGDTTPGVGGNGGDIGSGGGGGGYSNGDGGVGANGNAYMYVLSSPSIYAGLPGGQGGGGGGAASQGSGAKTGGAGGTGATFVTALVATTGAGTGGNGADGSQPTGNSGGNGGDGGNGGGAAGLVLLISPSITYNGTVTGRLVKIEGGAALDFILGYDVR